ncbi:MAG TPA: right-handed parallel beta-helix repeat-containing protein, partial [Lacipirellulaceae bacterium]
LVDNQYAYGLVDLERGQIVIPASGGFGGVVGVGPASRVKANSGVTGAFITNANYLTGGVPRTHVEHISIDGQRTIWPDPGAPTSGGGIAGGIALDGPDALIAFSRITGFRGIGAQVTDTSPELVSRNMIYHCAINRCHTGIKLAQSDTMIYDNIVWGCRDFGLHNEGAYGNIQSAGNHYYGFANAANTGTAVHNEDGDGNRFTNDTIADAHYGYVGAAEADLCTFTNCYFQHNNRRSMLLAGTMNRVVASLFHIPRGTSQAPWNDMLGIEITGARNAVSDSNFWLTNYLGSTPGSGNSHATALRVSGNFNSVQNCIFIDYLAPVGYARGIHIPTAIKGFRADVSIWGFEDNGDDFLDIDNIGIEGVHVIIHGHSVESPGFDPNDIAQYIDISMGWDNTKNSITLIDDATGETVPVDNDTNY